MNPFDEVYIGTPPWDIGRPQREIVLLAEAHEIRGRVLDLGCGTGENALYLCGMGHEVWGADSSAIAIRKAETKAVERGIAAKFMVWDAFDLPSLGRTFDTVIDSGLFHIFSDEERPLFVESLSRVLHPGGRYFILCFSDLESADWGGPRRVSKGEIRATFDEGWRVEYIRDAKFESNFHEDGGHAWLSSIRRVEDEMPDGPRQL